MKLRTTLARIKRRVFKKTYHKDPAYAPYWFNKILGGKVAHIVQIGSNDGKTGDPLNQLLFTNKEWKALFVEPVPYLFERLKRNYPDDKRFQFENVAINKGERLTFYWVNPDANGTLDNLPYWFDQLGSFNRQHIINELGERIEPFIFSEELEGVTLNTLFERNDIQQIDILHIDTEGYDWQILSQLDLKKHKPSFILYEKNHLLASDLNDSYNFLKIDYKLYEIGIDMLAVSKEVGTYTLNLLDQHMVEAKQGIRMGR